ncbi:arf-GAP with Rho-GAP domain, ANK repeat and PH domain-containing protein 1 isoform X1 [Hippoglossus stenolepis]|uniref:arf-GAP with Rho-GAP domain, ANK repeat and PH domain-containing protein 1 isoform X1 n=1 Tax=Hippoglossus stenolepis TaxID=195615 RepID=UPI001FAF47C2|nr:arf-GAP with Rho-GAP domain, ANK repeat and PH domain-containing protein 1 isoform X1 [Hippoglossus stenolepis]XP_047199621.1 arf-GAP with Rho-GAP domain, ANK repeat and PH domain-containing protein 1 isoform X1 [Hippoglossus stenolepis]XP_047199622.1 arf-GAP with Rho-GAP domain, ANK repeat and PH domain-containing protein 1 isoform X1 [Hippoglossus stenolepis]
MTPPPSPPVPKPRARYKTASLSSASSLDRNDDMVPLSRDEGATRLPPSSGSDNGFIFPTLVSVTDIIAANIPSLAEVAAAVGGSAPPDCSAPSAPPSIDSIAGSITTHIPSLACTANALVNPADATSKPASCPTPVPAANTGAASIVSSLANMAASSGIISFVPSAPPPSDGKPNSPAIPRIALPEDHHTDVGALSHLVMSSLDPTAGVMLPPVEGAAEPTDEVLNPSPHDALAEIPYVTVLSCWDGEEADSESSNEEEDTGVSPASFGDDGPMGGDSPSDTATHTHKVLTNPPGRIIPKRPAPPPPRAIGQSEKPGKRVKQKIPRAATIRVSRKKSGSGSSSPQSAVVRSSWLDVWKGFRHNVLWATLDGQQMSLWKKRTDRFSEVLFHVSSITNVKTQDKGRFTVYFRKKHYDFMAHSDEVQDGWVASLLASRGQPSPAPAQLHGPITIKESRSRAYAAVWGHDLWIYPNKEGYLLGVASFSVPLNVAAVKSTGKHSFTLITPYKSFNLSVDSSKDLPFWLDSLSLSIRSALSCSQVAMRLLENPCNKVCGDCGSANPEWASVNLLLVICQACAGQHRALGSNLSKVRSLKMDNKVWTEPLLQLFVTYGNRLANQVWAASVPAAEQLIPDSSDEDRSKFIQDKYSRGRYRRVHPLTSCLSLMDQRLREVACTDDIEETMSLICSGAKVRQSEPQSPSPILLAERAGHALQSELLRLNEYTEVPPHQPQSVNRRPDSAPSGEEEEELHGKLEEDRFLFSVENDSAACDVLDLREVLSVFIKYGAAHEFEMVTLSGHLICAADDHDTLLTHLVHILKVILPGGVSYADVGGASAVSKVCVVEVGGASSQSDAWLLLCEDGVSVHPVHRHTQQTVRMELSTLRHHELDPSKNVITMETGDRGVSLRFKEQHSCQSWFNHLQRALTNHSSDPHCPPAANHSSTRQSLYPDLDVGLRGSVPQGIERCISHITAHGLKVEGVYRRCGLAAKVNQLVEALMTSPSSAPLESDEQGVLDAGSALKQYVRQQQGLIPNVQPWLQAAGQYTVSVVQVHVVHSSNQSISVVTVLCLSVVSDQRSRFKAYQRLLRQLPDDNRATLSALFAHFYMVQVFSQVNKMSAQNLALILVPSLFHTLSQDLLTLTREFIIHHTLLFLTPEEEEEEQITVF